MFSMVARNHRIWHDAVPQGSEGGFTPEQVQATVAWGWITQAEADGIIATGGHTGAFQTMSSDPVAA